MRRMSRIALPLLGGAAALAVGLYAAGVQTSAPAQAAAVVIPAPATAAAEAGNRAVAIFAAGCFWGIEGVFEHVTGVVSVEAGYAGGSHAEANYEAVGSGRTGHAEAVRITYDPRRVSYAQLLHVLFSVAHDPTQLNRQGPDHGRQYRSAIFPQSAQQRNAAAAYIRQLGASGRFRARIVTSLENGGFWPAEAYHQNFMRRNPRHGYIVVHDAPKLRDLRATFPRLYTDRAAG
jgi:peptide-methionine (S)-S-oxide reductase